MIPPSPRTGFCLFCDDVRAEVGNKLSFMGVYGDAMMFPEGIPAEQPIIAPKLAIAIWLICDINDKPDTLTARVYAPPGRTEVGVVHQSSEQISTIWDTLTRSAQADARKISLQAVVQFGNFLLAHEGFIEVTIETDQGTIRAGRLRIHIPGRPDPSTLNVPPSSDQTPPAPERASPRRPSTRRSRRTPRQA